MSEHKPTVDDMFRICAAVNKALEGGPVAPADAVAAAVAAMAPNANTIAVGMIALYLRSGRTEDEIVARFIALSQRPEDLSRG